MLTIYCFLLGVTFQPGLTMSQAVIISHVDSAKSNTYRFDKYLKRSGKTRSFTMVLIPVHIPFFTYMEGWKTFVVSEGK